MFDEIIDKFYKKLSYKYSKERIEKIDAINKEIEKCDSDLLNTQIAENISCSWYESGGMLCSGDWINTEYTIDQDILKRIIKVGIQAYKEELIKKRDRLFK